MSKEPWEVAFAKSYHGDLCRHCPTMFQKGYLANQAEPSQASGLPSDRELYAKADYLAHNYSDSERGHLMVALTEYLFHLRSLASGKLANAQQTIELQKTEIERLRIENYTRSKMIKQLEDEIERKGLMNQKLGFNMTPSEYESYLETKRISKWNDEQTTASRDKPVEGLLIEQEALNELGQAVGSNRIAFNRVVDALNIAAGRIKEPQKRSRQINLNCPTGCKHFTGEEIRHHKDCSHYPESFSRMYDELELRNAKLEAVVGAVREDMEYLDEDLPRYFEHTIPALAELDVKDVV